MRLASIDIGSNGARLLISRVLTPNSKKLKPDTEVFFKDIEYTRFPLRLGKDVFVHKIITEKKKEQLLKLMQAFKLLMELHEVDDYMALATSAFREAENGEEMVELVEKETGIAIEVIDGSREAEILNQVIIKHLEIDKNYLHTDVGGGSTELNLYIKREKVASRSFTLGSIRNSDNRKSSDTFEEIRNWVEKQKNKYFENGDKVTGVGTGGNINKAFALINSSDITINNQDIRNLQHYLKNFSFKEKVNILKLNPDRADTIIPALDIYLNTMEWIGANEMIVPKVGLKDGMMELLMIRNFEKMSLVGI